MLIYISCYSDSVSTPDRGRVEVSHIQGFQCVLMPPVYGNLFQILGSVDLSGRQRLSGVSQKFGTGEGVVAEADEDSHQGGGGAAGVRIFL